MAAIKNARILIAPLDWGLGHATRCIPVIRHLLNRGCEVFVATDGPQLALLKAEFPSLNFLHLPGYGVKYATRGVFFSLLAQVPAIYQNIKKEHNLLQKWQVKYQFNGIISDNRYGLYHAEVSSVLITHQLALQLPWWAAGGQRLIRHLLYRLVNQFRQIWVPDVAETNLSLAGRLSHPDVLPQSPVTYLGILSRMQPALHSTAERAGLLISLSGPEPQRTLLENKLIKALPTVGEKIWLVRGLPLSTETLAGLPPHAEAFNHLPALQLQQLMQQCRLMICRSGYSTLMDAFITQTPIAAVPTPGQTEQEYLAAYLFQKKWAAFMPQGRLEVPALIGTAPQYQWPTLHPAAGLNTAAIDAWLDSL